MKAKSWILILFSITLFVYVIRHTAIDYIYQKTFEDSTLYDRGRWVKDDLNPDIIFLGSSMTKYSVIPKIINKNSKSKKGKTLNLGFDAATPYEMYITYMKNKKKFPNAKIFFFSIEPWILSKRYYQYKVYEKVQWTREEWEYYMPQWNMYRSYKNSLYKLSLDKPIPPPKVKEYGYVKKIHKGQFMIADKKEVTDFFINELDDSMGISAFQLNYLKKLKIEVEKSGAEFILLYVPNHHSYTEIIYNFNKIYNKRLSKLLNDYLGDSKQVGSFCPNDFDLVDEDFFDKYHLEHKGAIKFTESLGNVFDLSSNIKERGIVLDYSCGGMQLN